MKKYLNGSPYEAHHHKEAKSAFAKLQISRGNFGPLLKDVQEGKFTKIKDRLRVDGFEFILIDQEYMNFSLSGGLSEPQWESVVKFQKV